MKKINVLLTLTLFILAMSLNSCRVKRLNTRAYHYNHENFEYPEKRFLHSKSNIGIAFSGGGNRAASLTTGQLRALNELKLLDNVKYISAVSGGSWASVCYTFLPEDKPDNLLLGTLKRPEDLSLDTLSSISDGELLKSVSNSEILERYVKGVINFHNDEIFSRILNDIYLKPLGLGESRYVGFNKKSTADILNRKPNDKTLKYEDFYLVNSKKNRPFLIVNGTLVGGATNTRYLPSMHFEMTPIYSGISHFDIAQESKVGGGYIETFSMDYNFKKKSNDKYFVKLKRRKLRRFTLSDMMAISGNAPSTFLYSRWYLFIAMHLGLPEINLWSPYLAKKQSKSTKVKTKEYAMGDGGNLENLGLIPLLKRKVDKIVVFVNCKTPIRKTNKGKIILEDAIDGVFGIKMRYKDAISTNILSNTRNERGKLADTLYKLKKEGKPLLYTSKYKVNKRSEYGIFPDEGKWDSVQITWVYNDGFEKQYANGRLSEEVRSYYYNKGLDAFNAQFPHLPTILTTRQLHAIDYEISWSNMLAHFGSWVIMDKARYFKDVFSE